MTLVRPCIWSFKGPRLKHNLLDGNWRQNYLSIEVLVFFIHLAINEARVSETNCVLFKCQLFLSTSIILTTIGFYCFKNGLTVGKSY